MLYVTITGSYNLPTGVAASGTVRFTLVPAVRVNGTDCRERRHRGPGHHGGV
jgi:hypothetical protein